MSKKQQLPQVPDGVRYARWSGHALGVILVGLALLTLTRGLDGVFDGIKVSYFIFYGIILNLPFQSMTAARWKWMYGLLLFCSIAFVFLMVVSVLFNYMAAADQGERLGVPGFEGTLIFLSLLQVPAVLFQRKPNLID